MDRSNKKIVQIKTGSILFVEAIGNYVKVVTRDKEIQVREKISHILKTLPENEFMQVHKSFVVSKKHIDEIEGNRIMMGDFIIPVGKSSNLFYFFLLFRKLSIANCEVMGHSQLITMI